MRKGTMTSAGLCRTGRRGVTAAAAAYLLLALAWSVATPALWGTDESSNAAYGHHLARGHWPTIDEPKGRTDLPGLDQRISLDVAVGAPWRRDIWTAQQPPLYYALTGVAARVAGATLGPHAGLMASRFLTIVLGLGGVVATAWLAMLLVPSRPQIAVLSSGIVALTPTVANYGGQVYADPFVFTLCTVAFGLIVHMVRSGPSDRAMLALTTVWVAVALTKSTGAVTIAAGALAAAAWCLHARNGRGPGWRPSSSTCFAVVGLLAVATVPYGVNIARYGDPIGSTALLRKVARTPTGQPWFDSLARPEFWLHPWRLLVLEISDAVPDVLHPAMGLWTFMLIVPFLTGIMLGGRRLQRRRPEVRRLVLHTMAAPVAGATALVLLSSAWIANGGALHGRYFFPVLAPVAVVAAYGCELTGRARVAGTLVLVGLAGATVNAFWMLDASVRWINASPLTPLAPLVEHPWPVAFACCALAGAAALRLVWCYVHASWRVPDAAVAEERTTPIHS
jgi:hypothetical protein